MRAGHKGPTVKDKTINHYIGCWFRMNFIVKNNGLDITPNTEASSREATSRNVETNTGGSLPNNNTNQFNNSKSDAGTSNQP